jgi:hypothetical protein
MNTDLAGMLNAADSVIKSYDNADLPLSPNVSEQIY